MIQARNDADARQKQDRIDADNRQLAAQKELQQGFSSILQNQQESFAGILQKNQKQFIQTLEATKEVNDLAQESLKNITGGDSFPYIVPLIHAGIDPNGKYLLTDVTVTIRPSTDFTTANPAQFFRTGLPVGILNPDGWGKQLGVGISPKPDPGSVDSYIIEIQTQSTLFTQLLQFRKGKNTLPWAYRYSVVKHNFSLFGLRGGTKGADRATSVMNQPWSDDLGKGKLVKP